eukprot:5290082-Prorocentrum_lima.AAC.1
MQSTEPLTMPIVVAGNGFAQFCQSDSDCPCPGHKGPCRLLAPMKAVRATPSFGTLPTQQIRGS